jgi:cbb3-type cytochrome oxidase maturation protein
MDILFLLVPLSVLLALAVVGVLAWAVWSGQFESLESEGQRIFRDETPAAAAGDEIAHRPPHSLHHDTNSGHATGPQA